MKGFFLFFINVVLRNFKRFDIDFVVGYGANSIFPDGNSDFAFFIKNVL